MRSHCEFVVSRSRCSRTMLKCLGRSGVDVRSTYQGNCTQAESEPGVCTKLVLELQQAGESSLTGVHIRVLQRFLLLPSTSKRHGRLPCFRSVANMFAAPSSSGEKCRLSYMLALLLLSHKGTSRPNPTSRNRPITLPSLLSVLHGHCRER